LTDDAAPARMTFEFDGAPPYRGVPVVNGHKVHSVSSFDVHMAWNDLPEVRLTLLPVDALKIVLGNGPALVGVSDETREALISLGWTPPEQRPPGLQIGTPVPDSGPVPTAAGTELEPCSLDSPVTREQALGWAQQARWVLVGYYKFAFTFESYCTVANPDDPEAHEVEARAIVSGDPAGFYRFQIDGEPLSWDQLCYVRTPDLIIRENGNTLIEVPGDES
jgi:hypothetical protein